MLLGSSGAGIVETTLPRLTARLGEVAGPTSLETCLAGILTLGPTLLNDAVCVPARLLELRLDAAARRPADGPDELIIPNTQSPT